MRPQPAQTSAPASGARTLQRDARVYPSIGVPPEYIVVKRAAPFSEGKGGWGLRNHTEKAHKRTSPIDFIALRGKIEIPKYVTEALLFFFTEWTKNAALGEAFSDGTVLNFLDRKTNLCYNIHNRANGQPKAAGGSQRRGEPLRRPVKGRAASSLRTCILRL